MCNSLTFEPNQFDFRPTNRRALYNLVSLPVLISLSVVFCLSSVVPMCIVCVIAKVHTKLSPRHIVLQAGVLHMCMCALYSLGYIGERMGMSLNILLHSGMLFHSILNMWRSLLP